MTHLCGACGYLLPEHRFDCPTFMPMELQEPIPPKGINPKDKLGTKRVAMNLVPPASLIWEALAMTEGGLKYGPYNWRKQPVLGSIYLAAALRHLEKWQDGEDYDPKSRVHHLANAKACMGILLDAWETGNLDDDRPPKGCAASLLEGGEEIVKHLQGLFGNKEGTK